MAKYIDLSVALPLEKGVHAPHVRKRLAAMGDACESSLQLSPKLFHYAESGHAITKFPLIRFGGGKSFHIYGIGDEVIDFINSESTKVIKLLERAYNTELYEQRVVMPFNIKLSPRLLEYKIPNMVLQQSPYQYKKIMAMDAVEKNKYTESKIKSGLQHHMDFIDSAIDMDSSQTILGDVKINGDLIPVEVKPGVWFLSAKNVTFRTNLDLQGIFHVGHLISRGFGKIAHCKTWGQQ